MSAFRLLGPCFVAATFVACGGGDFESVDTDFDEHSIAADGGPCADESVRYLDGDGDGFGSTTTARACDIANDASWVKKGGDCDDGNTSVHPGQTSYFATGFVRSGTDETSFDYDCSGSEDEAGQSPKAACKVSALACAGSGYIPASDTRGGAGVNPFCGSAQQVSCVGNSLSCEASAPFAASTIPCR